MKMVFVVLGILLIILFLAWLFLAGSEKDRKWMVPILDVALIMVSALVVTMGFMMRSRHIADNVKAWDTVGEEGMPVRRQEEDARKMEGSESSKESEAFQGTGEAEESGENQDPEGTQGTGETNGEDEASRSEYIE